MEDNLSDALLIAQLVQLGAIAEKLKAQHAAEPHVGLPPGAIGLRDWRVCEEIMYMVLKDAAVGAVAA